MRLNPPRCIDRLLTSHALAPPELKLGPLHGAGPVAVHGLHSSVDVGLARWSFLEVVDKARHLVALEAAAIVSIDRLKDLAHLLFGFVGLAQARLLVVGTVDGAHCRNLLCVHERSPHPLQPLCAVAMTHPRPKKRRLLHDYPLKQGQRRGQRLARLGRLFDGESGLELSHGAAMKLPHSAGGDALLGVKVVHP